MYVNENRKHIVVKIGKYLYDVNGVIYNTSDYTKIKDDEYNMLAYFMKEQDNNENIRLTNILNEIVLKIVNNPKIKKKNLLTSI